MVGTEQWARQCLHSHVIDAHTFTWATCAWLAPGRPVHHLVVV